MRLLVEDELGLPQKVDNDRRFCIALRDGSDEGSSLRLSALNRGDLKSQDRWKHSGEGQSTGETFTRARARNYPEGLMMRNARCPLA